MDATFMKTRLAVAALLGAVAVTMWVVGCWPVALVATAVAAWVVMP